MKYYAVGEYGTEGNRPHYHAIVFNCLPDTLVEAWQDKDDEIGFVHMGEVTTASIHYVTGYLIGGSTNNEAEPNFSIMSKGLGLSYLENPKIFNHFHENKTFEIMGEGGENLQLPRYYRKLVFDDRTLARIGKENQEKGKEEFLKKTTEQQIGNAKSKIKKSKKNKKNRKL